MDKWVQRAVLGVIIFNIFQLYLYRQVWDWAGPSHGFSQHTIISDDELATSWKREATSMKSWPTISAFQPWTVNPKLQPDTCEGYFGNGFTEEHVLLKSPMEGDMEEGGHKSTRAKLRQGIRSEGRTDLGGSFRCFYSATMLTSICEGRQMVMDLDKIKVSRGGEAISEVVGRGEEAELPVFSEGAFQVQVAAGRQHKMPPGVKLVEESLAKKLIPRGQINVHTMRSLLENLKTVDSRSVYCAKRIVEPTLIVTRFEYANLFHTSTDWFSAYVSSRVVGLHHRPHLVFLDGHCKSPLDDGWKALFSSVTFAKHFSGPVCFDHAIFVPLGYDTPIFRHISTTFECFGCSVADLEKVVVESEKKKMTPRIREFGEFFANSFELKRTAQRNGSALHVTNNVNMQKKEINVLFVRREDYLAHPRHNGRPESRLSNEEEVYQRLTNWAVAKSTEAHEISIWNGLLAHMTMEEQIQMVKEADVLIGAHGAGLTYLLFAKPSTIVFELMSPLYRRPHFETMSFWMGMDYRVIHMDTSEVNVGEVIKRMNGILEDVKQRK